MAAAVVLLLLLLLLGPVSPETQTSTGTTEDASALLLLKKSFTNASTISSWSGDSSKPCDQTNPWIGVVCFNGAVTNLRLSDMGLSGTIEVAALSQLKSLRSLSFSNNAFSGAIPPLGTLHALRSLFLQRNRFSGQIPDDMFARMGRLKKLWLSDNAFTGRIPSSLAKATSLRELQLDGNSFSGPIPPLPLPSLVSFNASNNKLEGEIPASLSKFNATSFAANPVLCVPKLKPCDTQTEDAAVPAATGEGDAPDPDALVQAEGSGKLAGIAVVLILVACVMVVGLSAERRRREGDLGILSLNHSGKDDGGDMEPRNPSKYGVGATKARHRGGQKQTASSLKASGGNQRGGGGGAGADLVMVNDSKGAFGITDLMRAAAEVLGTGGLGSAYKAVMSNGVAVAVKRMREMNNVGKEVFDAEMRRLGRLSHPNILPPLAYHYRKEEKLIIFEYIPKGTLLYILHGDRGQEHAALDWPTRLRIIRGITGGLAYLHAELNSLDIPHGNLKSGNILLSRDYEPLLIDYGYITLVNPSQASQTMFAYKSPESIELRQLSPKSDVYCLGIIILEILTGKFPSQYLNNTKGGTDVVRWVTDAISEGREGELLDPEIVADATHSVPDMERLLRVGASCVDTDPDQRPDMNMAAARVEEVAAAAAAAGVVLEPALKDGSADVAGSDTWRSKSISPRGGQATTASRMQQCRDRRES